MPLVSGTFFRYGLHKNRNFKQSGVSKSGLSYKSSRKLPQKRKILTVQADYSFQIFRLYVVYEGEDKSDKISRLREKVKDWDKG